MQVRVWSKNPPTYVIFWALKGTHHAKPALYRNVEALWFPEVVILLYFDLILSPKGLKPHWWYVVCHIFTLLTHAPCLMQPYIMHCQWKQTYMGVYLIPGLLVDIFLNIFMVIFCYFHPVSSTEYDDLLLYLFLPKMWKMGSVFSML